jgi:hypothetical protein
MGGTLLSMRQQLRAADFDELGQRGEGQPQRT